MNSISKNLKRILFVVLVLFAIIGFFSTISLFSSNSNPSAREGISINDSNIENNHSPQQTQKVTTNRDLDFKYSEPTKISGSDYSTMKVMIKGESTSSLYKRAGFSGYYFVNILFFNQKNNSFHLLFNDKIMLIDSFSRYNQKDSTTSEMFFIGIPKDTDGDEYLTQNDNNILYSCDKNGNELSQITEEEFSVEQHTFLNDQNLLITVLKSENGKPRENWERSYLLYDLDKGKLNNKNKFESSYINAVNIFNK